MQELITIRQEDPEVWVGVIPTNNPLFGITIIFDAVYLDPRLRRERDFSAFISSVLRNDCADDLDVRSIVVDKNVSDQDAANFFDEFALAQCASRMMPNRLMRGLRERYAEGANGWKFLFAQVFGRDLIDVGSALFGHTLMQVTLLYARRRGAMEP